MIAHDSRDHSPKKPSLFERFSRKISHEHHSDETPVRASSHPRSAHSRPSSNERRHYSNDHEKDHHRHHHNKDHGRDHGKDHSKAHHHANKDHHQSRTTKSHSISPSRLTKRISRSVSSSPSRHTTQSIPKLAPVNGPIDPNRVQPTSFTLQPFPSKPLMRPWNIYLPPPHVYALYTGFSPRDMDDRWFIYSEGPDEGGKLKVHFHRSWTGMKVIELFVVVDVKGGGAGKIVGVKWAGCKEAGEMDEEEIKGTVRGICGGGLEITLEDE